MSMMRRIFRHVPGGVVASVMISYILLDNVLSQLRKVSRVGLEPTIFQSGYRRANRFAIATWSAFKRSCEMSSGSREVVG